METQHVHRVYDAIAEHFDDTRFSVWNCVRQFLDPIPEHSWVLDAGCGNGKNMTYRADLVTVGFDTCAGLLASSVKSGRVLQANGLAPPFCPNTFDAAICIAVIHHISKKCDRIRFVQNLIKCVKPNGTALITVWAMEQVKKPKWVAMNNEGDYLVPWLNRKDGRTYNRFYHLFSLQEVHELCASLDGALVKSVVFEKDNWCVTLTKVRDVEKDQ